MHSPALFIVLALMCIFVNVQGLENLMDTSVQKCLNCICHARSGCWSRYNCAKYSISKDYWQTAGSPAEGVNSDSEEAYRSCMNNENCILNAINSYTESFGQLDCNCDGKFDCKDRLAIHLFGRMCYNPKYGSTYANRFNDCAKDIGVSAMLSNEGSCEN